MSILLIILVTLIFLTSCYEIKTTDPDEAYKKWSGSVAPTDLQLLKGQYWQSAHWTKEYILFLKFKPTEIWWTEFVNQNQLQVDNRGWAKPTNTPNWFEQHDNFIMNRNGDDFDQGSRYFKDTLTNECYIYEIQL
jgi:hypothetical protein